MNRSFIRNTAAEFGVKIPAEVTDADALHTAVTTYREATYGAPEPDLSTLTADNIADTTDALLAYKGREARGRAVDELLGAAELRAVRAWSQAVPDLMEAFRAPFDDLAAKFTEALHTLGPAGAANADAAIDQGHADAREVLVDTAAQLGTLIRVRDELAEYDKATKLPATNYDHPTRIATFPSHDVFARVLPVRTAGKTRGSREWLVALASIPGVTLKWQTPAEQDAQVTAMPRESTAYTASASA